MLILAIETSCDDTGIAILEYKKSSQPKILADFASSQIKTHAPWGGVVPMLAKREHQKNLTLLLKNALGKTGLSRSLRLPDNPEKIKTLKKILEREPDLAKKLIPFLKKYRKPNINYIAVTQGPGLEPALWVGINFARALSYYWNVPLLPINHIEGHIASNSADGGVGGIANNKLSLTKNLPAICLVVSGGHTQLILIKKIGDYQIIGETRDDAAGEAFDKVAKMLNLGYPGGPAISRISKQNKRPNSQKHGNFSLPRPMINSRDFDFSFSGLKTAVLYLLQKITPQQIKKSTPAIAAEFQQAVVDVLTSKTISAVKNHRAATIILAGGVAANPLLRDRLSSDAKRLSLNFLLPPINLCMDNATMIALAAYWRLTQNRAQKINWRNLKAQENLRIS